MTQQRRFTSPLSASSTTSTSASFLSSRRSSFAHVDHNPDPETDISTQLLLARLTLSDLTAHTASLRLTQFGTRPDPNITRDALVALHQQESELRAWVTYLQDSILAQSIDRAIEADRETLRALEVVEASEREDRRAAEILEREGRLPATTDAQKAVGRRGFVIPESRAATIYGLTPSSSAAAGTSSRPTAVSVIRVECISCTGRLPQTQCMTAPCAHIYCHGCVISLVEACIRDETLYPIKCCRQPFPVPPLTGLLNIGLRQQFETKCREYRVEPDRRVYCSNPRCSAFLGQSTAKGEEEEEQDIICGTCRTPTCASCKEPSHPNRHCRKSLSDSDLALQMLAEQERWQTCPGCRAIVSLMHGCYHITCRCRTEFCYLCAAPWKRCRCPQWDEARLVVDAERRVENEMGQEVRRAEPRAFQNRVRNRVEELRVGRGEECTAHSWSNRSGAGQCEECSAYMPIFLKICRNCAMLACRRCAMNRL